MAIVFLDLDGTLINGDSDYLWGDFLVNQGLKNAEEHKKINLKFYEDYKNEQLDIEEYLQFALAPLAKFPIDELLSLNHEFVETIIQPLIYKEAIELIAKHKKDGDKIIITSATNSFIVQPIANYLGVKETISTQVETVANEYTGKHIGLPNFRENKVENINLWLDKNNLGQGHLTDSFAYSDSVNDLPLLELVNRPIATNPDKKLLKIAQLRNWQVIKFHE